MSNRIFKSSFSKDWRSLVILLLTFVSIGLLFLLLFQTKANTIAEHKTETALTDEHKQKALVAESFVTLLNSCAKNLPATQDEVVKHLEKISKSDYSSFDKINADKFIYFSEHFDKGLVNATYNSLVSLAYYVQKDGKVSLQSPEIVNSIYVDLKTKRAFISVNTVTNKNTIFSLEMVYVDGVWKLAPYSFLEQVRYSAALQQLKEKQ